VLDQARDPTEARRQLPDRGPRDDLDRFQLVALRGDFDRAREMCRQAVDTFEEFGLWVDAATVSLCSGRVELFARDAVAAERELRRGYDYFFRLGERYILSSVTGLLAEALLVQGRLDDAEALTREGEDIAAEDDIEAQPLWRLVRAEVLAHHDEFEKAEALAREAVGLLAPTDDFLNRSAALGCLASVLFVAGREEDGAQGLKRAHESASRGSPVMSERLDELSALVGTRSSSRFSVASFLTETEAAVLDPVTGDRDRLAVLVLNQ
jgi:ATP/maltotriose-dependent transcriptional regulator MalT